MRLLTIRAAGFTATVDACAQDGGQIWFLSLLGSLPAVALLGTRVARSTVQALSRFRRLYLALGSDEAGRRAAAQLAAELRGQALIVDLPPGVHDLNDLGRLPDGREAFLSCLQEANDRKEKPWDTRGTAPPPLADAA